MMRPVMILHLGADTWMPCSLARLMINEQQIDAIVDYAHCPWLLRLPRLSRLERSQNFKGDCRCWKNMGAKFDSWQLCTFEGLVVNHGSELRGQPSSVEIGSSLCNGADPARGHDRFHLLQFRSRPADILRQLDC